MNPFSAALIYIAVVGFCAFAVTVYDKLAAQAKRFRIPEATLLLIAAIGGSFGEYAAMLLIRHKTKKKKFMVTLPIICIIHAALLVLLYYRTFG